MGLNTLTTILEKKGSAFLLNFLSEELVITEKLDTYRILFEKQGDKLVFFKKDNTPLNLIERTLTNVWEDAIIELSTIIGDIKLPENMRFGISYTPVERPIRIPYSKIPKYILTDVTLRKGNKVIESFGYDEVTAWAAMLKLGRPPVIFSGRLNELQKNMIMQYGLAKYDELNDISFTSLIKKMFGGSYSGEDIIEGIIIKSGKDVAQVTSYEFDLLNEAYQREEYPRDYYDIVLLNLNKFMDNYNIPVLEGQTSDEMYLELISDVFNKFCEKNPNLMENVKVEYLTPPAFGYFGGLNLLLIKNRKTLEILEKGGKIYEALYRVILSSLRKPKKEFGLLTESDVEKFNTYVYLIKDFINEAHEEPKDEPEHLNEIRADNVVITAMSKKQPSDVDNMRVIASIQKAFEPHANDIRKGTQKAVVYVTDFQPFTKSQMDNVLTTQRTWKCPVILATVSKEKRMKGKSFKFSDELVRAQLQAVAQANSELIPAYFVMDSWSLADVFKYCRPMYEPVALVTDAGKKSEFAIQLYFEDEVMGGRIGVDKEFNIGDIDNVHKDLVMRAIEDGMFVTFKEYTPEPIWNFYNSIVSEYRSWAGELPTQFEENSFV